VNEQHALHDALTGLGNRRKLLLRLDAALVAGGPWLMALFDLDGFKRYNDTFGHPAGDDLLVRLATRIREAMPAEAAFRFGGDEFLVLAPAKLDVEGLLERAARALSEDGEGFRISASFGAVFLPEETSDPSTALHLCDQRLYNEKSRRAGRRGRPQDVLLEALNAHEPSLDSCPQIRVRGRRLPNAEHLPVGAIDPLAGSLSDLESRDDVEQQPVPGSRGMGEDVFGRDSEDEPSGAADHHQLRRVLDLHGSGPVVTYGPFFARALDDSHVLGDTEGSGVDVRPWKVLNLATTAIEPIATDEVSRTSDGYALGHGLFLVSGTLDGRTYNIGLVGVASGGEQPLLSQDWGSGSLLLRPYLTSDRWALLSDMSWESGRGGTLRVLDLQTGKVLDRIVNPEP